MKWLWQVRFSADTNQYNSPDFSRTMLVYTKQRLTPVCLGYMCRQRCFENVISLATLLILWWYPKLNQTGIWQNQHYSHEVNDAIRIYISWEPGSSGRHKGIVRLNVQIWQVSLCPSGTVECLCDIEHTVNPARFLKVELQTLWILSVDLQSAYELE